MRRWILVLFVVLLPWRLWAADAMALQMAAWPEPPAQQHLPCHGVSDEAAALPHSPTHDHGHPMCLLCDVCHNALWMTSLGQMAFTKAPRYIPRGLPERVTGMALPPTLKPPIA
jgi:hypothetical protein